MAHHKQSYIFIISWALFLLYSKTVSAAPIELHGINYNTRQGPDYAWDKCKTYEQIVTDLTMLKRITSRIRILSLADCGQGELVLTVAKELGLQVWLGVWVSEFEYVFENEKGTLFELINKGLVDSSTVLGITVGSEAVYREEVTSEQIIDYMNQIKGILANGGLEDLPVTITEIAPTYSRYANLRSAVDVVYANIFPFWEGIPIDGAIADMVADLEWVMNLPESSGKELIIGETGWPESGTATDIEGNIGVPSVANQVQFFVDFYCQIGVQRGWKYYWFTAIDNRWRQLDNADNTIEGTFGFLSPNLLLKSHFRDLSFTCSDGVTYSFAENDWSIPFVPNETPRVTEDTEDFRACASHDRCAALAGNCCPTDGENSIFLSCCDNDNLFAPDPTASPSRQTSVPTRLTPSPTRETPSPTSATPLPTRQTPAPSIAPVTSSPTVAPITASPSIAPVTLDPTVTPLFPTTASPTLAPVTMDPTAAPVTAEPSAAATTVDPPTASPITGSPTTGSPTTPGVPTVSPAPTILTVTIDMAEGLQFAFFGLLQCQRYCVNALEAKQINHTKTFYNNTPTLFQVLENIPRITRIDPIFPYPEDDDDDGTRRLQEDGQIGIQITYDHTFEYYDMNSDIHVHQLAGLPFATEALREEFLQTLQEYNIFENVTGMTRIFFPEITSAPSPEPSAATRPPSSTAGVNTGVIAPKGEVYSIGVIIGIAVGGSALLLICLFCFCYAKKRAAKEQYRPHPDELSFGFSTVYTKEQT